MVDWVLMEMVYVFRIYITYIFINIVRTYFLFYIYTHKIQYLHFFIWIILAFDILL